ncbi:hypothetical protein FSC37_20970 [Piscinibacter aquaticus]|uniref:Exo-alpha-sialidase n=1 Tax=Piscinibacter aquaticus TaxID=392597 RepID=A0A5C6U311_9BURK|nr:hypothetical protein FSC37_20970 [Piscinibacter aquaticus]
MVVAHQGNLLAMWVAPDGAGNPQLVGMRSPAASSTWTAPRRLAPALGFSAFAMPPPHALADGTGTAWVLWFDATNKVPMVSRGALGADTAWAEPLALASETCRGTGVQRLAVNAQGRAVAMWQRAGSTAGLNYGWCTRRFEGGAWGAEQVLGPAAGHNFASSSLQLVLTDAGRPWRRGTRTASRCRWWRSRRRPTVPGHRPKNGTRPRTTPCPPARAGMRWPQRPTAAWS